MEKIQTELTEVEKAFNNIEKIVLEGVPLQGSVVQIENQIKAIKSELNILKEAIKK